MTVFYRSFHPQKQIQKASDDKQMNETLDRKSAAYFYPRNNRSALVLLVHMDFIVGVVFIRESQAFFAEHSLAQEILINLI